jgi:uncharacterized protein YcbX
MIASVARLWRYPIKGLSAQDLASVELSAGAGLPHDRRFAITHGASTFDAAAPAWRPKTNFVMLARNERLAALETSFDEITQALTIFRAGRQVARGELSSVVGRTLIEQFLAAYLRGEIPGSPKLVEAPGHMFSDAEEKLVSIINRASVVDLERVAKCPVDPRRFRGNVLLDGLPAWAEAEWVGRRVMIGGAQLVAVSRIARCAAINVNPATGVRDANLVRALFRGFGHEECGVYARVIAGGRVAVGDAVEQNGDTSPEEGSAPSS